MSISRLFARAVLRLLFRVEVKGSVEPSRNMLVVANHQSFLDGVLLYAFLPFEPTYLVHTTIASRWYFKGLLKFVNHIVIDTTSPIAMKKVIALLESGAQVAVFPEGRITSTGSRMKIYDGPAFVAAKAGARVLPVHIDGAVYSHFARVGRPFPKEWFPKITVTLDPTHVITMPEAPRARDRRRLASNHLRRIMQHTEVASRRNITIPEAFLNAVDLYGRRRPIVEDIRGKEETF